MREIGPHLENDEEEVLLITLKFIQLFLFTCDRILRRNISVFSVLIIRIKTIFALQRNGYWKDLIGTLELPIVWSCKDSRVIITRHHCREEFTLKVLIQLGGWSLTNASISNGNTINGNTSNETIEVSEKACTRTTRK